MSFESLCRYADEIGSAAFMEKLLLRERILALVDSGMTYRHISKVLNVSLRTAYWAGRSRTTRKRGRIPKTLLRNIRRDLTNDSESLTVVASRYSVSRETVRRIRRGLVPHSPATTKPHRCEKCGAVINSTECLRCSLLSPRSSDVT